MAQESFKSTVDSVIAPAQTCFAIVPDDIAELAHVTKSIYIGLGGDITLLTLRGNTPVTFRNVPEGFLLDVRARAVMATNTTAGELVGLA